MGPLHDQWGRPIIPRPEKDWFEADVAGFGCFSYNYCLARANVWAAQIGAETTKWGPFGQKKKFMDAHPGATDKEWDAFDAEKRRARSSLMSFQGRDGDGE